MTDNLSYYNIGRTVPESAKKPIQGGRMNGRTDINPMWRIKILTEMFGPCGIGWYYRTVREWTESYKDSVAAFVRIELYIKVDGEWSMPIQGTGGNMFVEVQKSGPYVSDECYKMATTDAISVACKQLGIGADVYWEKDSTKYGSGRRNQEPQKDQEPGKNQEPGRPADEETRRLQEELCSELSRTGFSPEAACRRYGTDSLDGMSRLQMKECIRNLKTLPAKAVNG